MTNLVQVFAILILLSVFPPNGRAEIGATESALIYPGLIVLLALGQWVLIKLASRTYAPQTHKILSGARIGLTMFGATLLCSLDLVDGLFDRVIWPLELGPILGLALVLPMLFLEWWASARSRIGYRPELGPYLRINLGMFLFTVSPMVLLSLFQLALVWMVPDYELWTLSFEFLGAGVLIVGLLLMSWVLPLGVRFLLKKQSLKGTELEQRLHNLAKRMGVKVDRLYLWRSKRAGMHTAFLIGFAWPFRYVFVSDGLLEALTIEEQDAVLAHELGHARHRHLLIFLGLFITLILVQVLTLKLIAPDLPLAATLEGSEFVNADIWLAQGIMVVPFVAFLLSFGYISRRFERQADFASARVTSPHAIASALDRLGHMAGGVHQKKGWRHFSIARRIQELRILTLPEGLREASLRKWSKEAARPMLLAFVFACATLVALFPLVRDDILTGKGTLLNYQADLALAEAGQLAPVVPQYEDALAAMDQYVAHPDAVPLHRFIVLCNAAAIEFLIYGTEARADSLRARLELEDPEVQKFVSLRLEAGLSRSAEIRRMTTQNPQDLREPAMPSSDAIHH